MTEHLLNLDPKSMVVVPARPGPLIRLNKFDQGPDEVGEILDELFGEPDDRGPGPADAVMILGGTGAVVASQIVELPGFVFIGGVISAGLGAALPIRSLWRRVGSAHHSRKLRGLIGDGTILRIDHTSTSQLYNAHRGLVGAASSMDPEPRRRVLDIAHAAVVEVASLLDGGIPGDPAEVRYVEARTKALTDLTATVDEIGVDKGGSEHRRAIVEARDEVEQLTGSSSLTEAADLANELMEPGDPHP